MGECAWEGRGRRWSQDLGQNAVGWSALTPGPPAAGSPAEVSLELREPSEESSVPDPPEFDGVHFLLRLRNVKAVASGKGNPEDRVSTGTTERTSCGPIFNLCWTPPRTFLRKSRAHHSPPQSRVDHTHPLRHYNCHFGAAECTRARRGRGEWRKSPAR